MARRSKGEQRVEQTVRLFREHRSATFIKTKLAEEWGVTQRTVSNYMRAARAQIAKAKAPEAEVSRTQHVERRQMLYEHAIEAGDHRLALEVLRDLAKLEGLYVARVAVSNELTPVEQVGEILRQVFRTPAVES